MDYFSVVIPLYNKQEFIGRTIRSVLNQKYINFELIIVDDGSTDKSAEIVKTFNDKRIKLFQRTNHGVSAARNFGIDKAKYNYVALLDGDDEWKNNYLEEFVTIIKQYPNYIGYSCNFDKVGTKCSKETEIQYLPALNGELKNYYKYCCKGFHLITSSTVCLNKKILLNTGFKKLFPVGVKRGEDLDAWTRLNLNHNFYFINKILARIHVDRNSASNKSFYIDEAFDYFQWLGYQADSWQKSIFLKLYAIKKMFRVYAKSIGLTKLKRIVTRK